MPGPSQLHRSPGAPTPSISRFVFPMPRVLPPHKAVTIPVVTSPAPGSLQEVSVWRPLEAEP